MRYFILLFFVYFACAESKKIKLQSSWPKMSESSEGVSDSAALSTQKPRLMASLKLMSDANGDKADQVCIYELKEVVDKDSIATLYYKIIFLKNKKIIGEYRGQLNSTGAKGDWNVNEDLMNDKRQGTFDRRFVLITNGYPACGYPHTHLLLYLGDTDISLIKEWRTVWDGGYGSDVEFYPTITANKASAFSTVGFVIDQAPMEDEVERLEFSYSDSILYQLNNGKWIKTAITPKGKVFRKKTIPFNDYYKN